ncbi:hypothetical protein PTT_02681 [Pyrenophora teres f. teres 0-1]|uniref:Uncharacterized protein n=1 Tax=Pyrenophora teres f. teres (strain 0-1) TaxID=861557 RepID=E3RDP5_PYRTT|nr:hypothetical protein PTT_02681 [Pyrenophora teres f. teres 0-1]
MALPPSAVRDTLGAGPNRVWFFSSYHDGGNSLSEMHPCADWLSTHHCPEVPPPVQRAHERWKRAGTGAGAGAGAGAACSSHPDHHGHTAQRNPGPAAMSQESKKKKRRKTTTKSLILAEQA